MDRSNDEMVNELAAEALAHMLFATQSADSRSRVCQVSRDFGPSLDHIHCRCCVVS